MLFRSLAATGSGRTVPSVVPTVDGGAFILGGLRCSISGCSDPPETFIVGADGDLVDGPPLAHGRASATATVLLDGSILMVGGYISGSVSYVERLTP